MEHVWECWSHRSLNIQDFRYQFLRVVDGGYMSPTTIKHKEFRRRCDWVLNFRTQSWCASSVDSLSGSEWDDRELTIAIPGVSWLLVNDLDLPTREERDAYESNPFNIAKIMLLIVLLVLSTTQPSSLPSQWGLGPLTSQRKLEGQSNAHVWICAKLQLWKGLKLRLRRNLERMICNYDLLINF